MHQIMFIYKFILFFDICLYLISDGIFSASVARPSKQHKMKRQLPFCAKETAKLEHKNSEIFWQRMSPSEKETRNQP